MAIARHGDLHELELDRDVLRVLEAYGSVPLPPYLAREAEPDDRERYQTVYAEVPGAIAAPTAGLHFDRRRCRARPRGVASNGGRFMSARAPSRPCASRLSRSTACTQNGFEPAATVGAIAATRGGRPHRRGRHHGREGARGRGVRRPVAAIAGETEIFIRPGHRFRVVDALLTNFHLPESTLLMLVSAFAGRERVLAAYHHAITGATGSSATGTRCS